MTRRHLIFLLLIGLLTTMLAGRWIRTPGYMDADYYFATAHSLVSGNGYREPFLWNYLDDPSELPHPSHLYWMPATSWLAAAGMRFGRPSFQAAQLPFILLAAALPLFTATLGFRLHGNAKWAVLGGVLAVMPGYYLPYLLTTDAFAPFALIGGLALWTIAEASQQRARLFWLAAGLIIGLAHLTRADGPLLLVPALYALWQQRDDRARALLLMFSGYVFCMLPWWWRNMDVVGTIMSPAGVRTLWLTAYDEIFTYPGRVLTPAHWWASGLDSILKARVQALGINIQRLIGENGILILWPFIVAGAGKLWGRLHVRVGALYLTTLFCTMTAVFPFVGSRGGLFHSGVATLPLSLALVPAGYQAVLDWASARRGWDRDRATKVFSVAGFILVGLLTLGLFWTRVIGPDINTPVWEQPQRSYEAIGRAINEVDHSPGVVAVNNPPGFYLATGMDSLVVPSGGLDTLRAAVSAFGVEWVVLDVNRPVGLAGLYAGDTDVGWLVLTRELNGVPFEPVRIYHVELGS